MVVIDARPHLNVAAISHKQFVEHVGAQHVADRGVLEALPQARSFSFPAESTAMEQVRAWAPSSDPDLPLPRPSARSVGPSA